jgi:hypothetical protein
MSEFLSLVFIFHKTNWFYLSYSGSDSSIKNTTGNIFCYVLPLMRYKTILLCAVIEFS